MYRGELEIQLIALFGDLDSQERMRFLHSLQDRSPSAIVRLDQLLRSKNIPFPDDASFNYLIKGLATLYQPREQLPLQERAPVADNRVGTPLTFLQNVQIEDIDRNFFNSPVFRDSRFREIRFDTGLDALE